MGSLELGKPVSFSGNNRDRHPCKGMYNVRQVKEGRKSECPAVMAGIGLSSPLRKQADFCLVLNREKVVIRFLV